VARLPVLALVGRPNVGKSTLFNRLTRSRAALVADVPGLTRDRQYGRGRVGERAFIVIDSGGFEPVAKSGIQVEMAHQTRQAVLEADSVVFVVDGREGLTPHDMEIARELRRTARHVFVAVNKTEGMPRMQVAAEFHELGLGDPLPVSAAHGDGVRELVEIAFEHMGDAGLPKPEPDEDEADGDVPQAGAGEPGEGAPAADGGTPPRVRVAVVGRPNVGKSTLINALIGEQRLIAFDQPGTTRDSVEIEFERAGRPYTLIDTAGLRRRGKVTDMIEKFSVLKSLQAIEDSHVCVLLLDASEPVSEQDATIASYILEAGRALVLAINKWDLADAETRERLRNETERKLHFLRFARQLHLSALKGRGIDPLLRAVDAAYAAATAKLSTPRLTRAMQAAVEKQAPPKKGPFRPKLRYAHQGGRNPPVIVIHGSGLDNIGDTYRRYLEGWFRDAFKLQGTPLRIEFRSSVNPYV